MARTTWIYNECYGWIPRKKIVVARFFWLFQILISPSGLFSQQVYVNYVLKSIKPIFPNSCIFHIFTVEPNYETKNFYFQLVDIMLQLLWCASIFFLHALLTNQERKKKLNKRQTKYNLFQFKIMMGEKK